MNNTTEYISEPEQQEKLSKMKDTEKKKKKLNKALVSFGTIPSGSVYV